MALSVAVSLLFSFSLVLSVFAHEETLSLFDSPVTFCHMVASTSDQVYVSFLRNDMGHVTLYQTVWALSGRHLLECTIRGHQSLVRSYQSFCEASQVNSTQHPFTDHQDPEVLQTLSAFQVFQQSCLMSSGGLSQAPQKRTKRETPKKRHGAVPGTMPEQDQDAEAVPKTLLEGGTRTRAKRGWTIPGTLWCGAGSSAGNFTDLGIFQGTDLCCREHDHCTERLLALEFKYGVRNYRMHTVSHCDCDYRFKQCLHHFNDTISTFVGITFFNLLEMPCFTMEEREGCQAWHWWGGCKEYGLTPFAVLQNQGLYNYSHPFSDALDERYKPSITTSGSSISPVGSTVRKILPLHRSKNGSLRPDRNQRKKTRLRKHQRRPVQTTRSRDTEVHMTTHLPTLEPSFIRTDSNPLRLKDQKVTSVGTALWPEVIEDTVHMVVDNSLPEAVKDTVHKVIDGPLHEVMEDTMHKMVDSSLPEAMKDIVHKVIDSPLPEVMEDRIHRVVDSPLPEVMEDRIHRMVDSPLPEVMEDRIHRVVDSPLPETMKETEHKVMMDTSHMLTDGLQSEGSQNPLPEMVKLLNVTILEPSLPKVMKAPLHERLDSSLAHLTEIAQTEGRKDLPSESFPNYLQEQKHIRRENFYDQKLQSNTPDLVHSIAHPGAVQTSMIKATEDQLSPDQTISNYTTMAEPREGPQSTDQTHTGYTRTGQLTASNIRADQISMFHPSTEPPTTDHFTRAHLTADQLGISWPNFDDQIFIAQQTEKKDTSTLRTNQGQSHLNLLHTHPVTPPIIIHASSPQSSQDVPTLTTLHFENKFGNHASHGQLITYPVQKYVDSSTISTHVENPESENTRAQNFEMLTLEPGLHIHSKQGAGAAFPPEVETDYKQRNVFLNENDKPVQGLTRITSHHIAAHPPSTTQRIPDNDNPNKHHISKSCGCYRRLDQCEYKIAPYEEKFQLHNLDRKTLYHCNCTRRLARFLQRKKRPNEVQEVLSDFVSPSCFVLEPREVCDGGDSCRSVSTAVLAPSGHLKRTFRLLQKSSKDWTSLHGRHPKGVENPGRGGASLKVKREELKGPGATPEPIRLYDQCLQRVRNPRT